jgi:hypothetical protein
MLANYKLKYEEKLLQKQNISLTLTNDKHEYAIKQEVEQRFIIAENQSWQKVVPVKEEYNQAKRNKNTELVKKIQKDVIPIIEAWKTDHERLTYVRKVLRNIKKRVAKTTREFIKCVDEVLHLKMKIEEYELHESIQAIDKDIILDKKKLKKQNAISEPILARVYRLPDEIKRIIQSYFTMETRASILEDKFKNILATYKSGTLPPMFRPFLEFIGTSPEFLYLLPKKEARHQIPSLTPRGMKWRHYSYCDEVKYPKLVKNRIRWAVHLAKIGDPAFAHKIMKTIIIFSQPNKYRLSGESPKKYLTLADLPTEYR